MKSRHVAPPARNTGIAGSTVAPAGTFPHTDATAHPAVSERAVRTWSGAVSTAFGRFPRRVRPGRGRSRRRAWSEHEQIHGRPAAQPHGGADRTCSGAATLALIRFRGGRRHASAAAGRPDIVRLLQEKGAVYAPWHLRAAEESMARRQRLSQDPYYQDHFPPDRLAGHRATVMLLPEGVVPSQLHRYICELTEDQKRLTCGADRRQSVAQ